MRINIIEVYDMLEGKPYCRVDLFGRSVEEYANGADDLTYNFIFELPDSLSSLTSNKQESILRKILDHIEIGINQMLKMYTNDLDKLNNAVLLGISNETTPTT